MSEAMEKVLQNIEVMFKFFFIIKLCNIIMYSRVTSNQLHDLFI